MVRITECSGVFRPQPFWGTRFLGRCTGPAEVIMGPGELPGASGEAGSWLWQLAFIFWLLLRGHSHDFQWHLPPALPSLSSAGSRVACLVPPCEGCACLGWGSTDLAVPSTQTSLQVTPEHQAGWGQKPPGEKSLDRPLLEVLAHQWWASVLWGDKLWRSPLFLEGEGEDRGLVWGICHPSNQAVLRGAGGGRLKWRQSGAYLGEEKVWICDPDIFLSFLYLGGFENPHFFLGYFRPT